jgi:anti-sigma regulatory factor (Ser/Thr protein kinase)
MDLNTSTISDRLLVPIVNETDVAEARRKAAELAESLQFNAIQLANTALVSTELSTNLLKHARGGALMLQSFRNSGSPQVEMWALDKGPGMSSVQRAMEDGYSTAGSLGTGLGAANRLSSDFAVYSNTSRGTIVWSRIGQSVPSNGKAAFDIAGISFPKKSETVCGDNWGFIESKDSILLMVADGLGHGTGAAEASIDALTQLLKSGFIEPADLLKRAHESLKHTRGAALSVALINKPNRTISYSALGNVSAVLQSAEHRQSLLNEHGTAGYQANRIRQYSYSLPESAYLIMHSDGLASSWDINSYQGLFGSRPGAVCGLLFRDYTKGEDDATVVVARLRV